jgi:hypothetical protein
MITGEPAGVAGEEETVGNVEESSDWVGEREGDDDSDGEKDDDVRDSGGKIGACSTSMSLAK